MGEEVRGEEEGATRVFSGLVSTLSLNLTITTLMVSCILYYITDIFGVISKQLIFTVTETMKLLSKMWIVVLIFTFLHFGCD